jgi:hypothetical protein
LPDYAKVSIRALVQKGSIHLLGSLIDKPFFMKGIKDPLLFFPG